MKTVPCKGCGRPIVWAVMDGKRIPLDPQPAVYTVVGDGSNGTVCERDRPGGNVMGQLLSHMVTHFATCPKARDFSGSSKKKEVAP